MRIWLADLTYTQQMIASDFVPAAIGMIAEYLEKKMPDQPKTKLFKFPENLSKELQHEKPDLIGFSNYVWNSSLGDAYMKKIKEIYPEIITVSGGPNFPTTEKEQLNYLKKKPWIDYYIVKEGEHAFFRLIEELKKKSSIDVIAEVPNIVFLKNDKLYVHKKIERIMDLSAIPSPYLSGKLDGFLDGKLLPIIQTNRGCPFSCTFCTEGQSYWSKVRPKQKEVIEGEVSYIADRMNNLESDKKRSDLYIADSNFGMYKEDLDTCRAIAKEQKKTGYPKYINVSTGKNKQERVLEAAKIVNGGIRVNASVQSMDPKVQENIKRKNISSSQILDVALKSSEIGANSYSEVILSLPGDTTEKHFSSLEKLVNAGFTNLAMYQLMILPGTELGSDLIKEKYKMSTKYRVLPRCFGTYEILGENISVAEIEEICTHNNTLSFNDYLECRKMDLIVYIFFNDSLFEEASYLLKKLNIPMWDWLNAIYKNSSKPEFKKFNNLLNDFLEDSEKELWTKENDLRKFTQNANNIGKYITGEFGSNLLFKYKTRSLTTDLKNVGELAIFTTTQMLSKKIGDQVGLKDFVRDLINYKQCQTEEIFDLVPSVNKKFKFNIPLFISSKEEMNENMNINNLKFEKDTQLNFSLSKTQIDQIKSYNNIFGNSVVGISRTLSKVYFKQLLRTVDGNSAKKISQKDADRRWGGEVVGI